MLFGTDKIFLRIQVHLPQQRSQLYLRMIIENGEVPYYGLSYI